MGYYFLYTLMANPRQIDPGTPPVAASLETFRELAARIGPERVIWRYDPIFLSSITDPGFHERAYRLIAEALQGCTKRSMVSIVQRYRKIEKRMAALAGQGIELLPWEDQAMAPLLCSLAEIAQGNGMEIQSCADDHDVHRYGIPPGKCVDDELISRVFGLELESRKDTCQRKQCNCVASKDIGMYDSCLFGCVYCYATTSFERACANYRAHDAESPSLLG
jgi:hypothetical protein